MFFSELEKTHLVYTTDAQMITIELSKGDRPPAAAITRAVQLLSAFSLKTIVLATDKQYGNQDVIEALKGYLKASPKVVLSKIRGKFLRVDISGL